MALVAAGVADTNRVRVGTGPAGGTVPIRVLRAGMAGPSGVPYAYSRAVSRMVMVTICADTRSVIVAGHFTGRYPHIIF